MWTAETAPAWATRFVEHDRDLTGELAVWRAVNAVPDTDARPTGPPRADLAGWRSQHELDRRTERRVFGSSACHNFSAQALADGIDPRLAGDPHWSALARQLENAHHQGVDISALARHAASGRPLPDEQPAAALHWRLVDAIAATRTKQHPDTSKTTGVPLQRTASRRTYVDEPAPARSRPPDIDYARAFGNKPAPGRGVSR
jgi:hypothetical protein